MCSTHDHLDSAQSQKARLLCFEVLVYFICTVAVDVGFLHEGESHAVVQLAEFANLFVILRFLASKLSYTTITHQEYHWNIDTNLVTRETQ